MAIAYLLDPLVKRLTKRGMSRLVAALLILGGFALAFALLSSSLRRSWRSRSPASSNTPGLRAAPASARERSGASWIKHVVGDNLVGADKSVGDVMNQAMGYLSGLLASLWAKARR